MKPLFTPLLLKKVLVKKAKFKSILFGKSFKKRILDSKILEFLNIPYKFFKVIHAGVQSDMFRIISNKTFLSTSFGLIQTYIVTDKIKCMVLCIRDPTCLVVSLNDLNECRMYSCFKSDMTASTTSAIYKKTLFEYFQF